MALITHLAALTWKEGNVYVADCPALRIASQGETEQEALDNLKEAVELYFEDEPMPELPVIEAPRARDLEVRLAS